MNFKDSYKKDFEDIVPDDAFLSKLSASMEAAETDKKRSRIRIVYTSVAAVFVLAISGALLSIYNPGLLFGNNGSSQPGVNMQAGNNSLGSFATNQIGEVNKWCSDDLSEQENYDFFVSRLSDSKDIKKLYSGTQQVFSDSDLVNTEEISSIGVKINTAKISGENAPSGSAQYYMAVFNNGDIIKFTIYNDKYVVVNDLSATFIISQR